VIAMTDFRDQDLTGARFENVSLRRASRRIVDLSGAQLRSVMLHGTRMRGVELCDVDIYGELQHVVINGVDIAPLVEAELNRRMPDRAKCVPATATGSGSVGDPGAAVGGHGRASENVPGGRAASPQGGMGTPAVRRT
jgi:Pentapeptide repeats (8 copies)